MKIKNLGMAALIAGGCGWVGGSALAAPIGNFEGPQEGEVVAGVVNIRGWTTDSSPIARVELGTDDKGWFLDLGYGGSRGDVARAHPEIEGSRESGFAGFLNSRYLPNGPLTLYVRATNEAGESEVFERHILVSNTPDDGQLWDEVDLTGASASIAGQQLVLDNVTINGRRYDNINLVFDPFTSAYRIAYFASDLDKDGIPDTEDAPIADRSLDETEINNLRFMREEEKLARDVYLTLAGTWGHSTFVNIASSEQSHMDAMALLLAQYGITDPVVSDELGVFQNTELQQLYDNLIARGETSLLEALNVGALIEEVDIADLQEAIQATDEADIIAAYENLLRGSYNHLRAFVSAIEQSGGVYQAQLLDPDTLNEILANGGAMGGNGQGQRGRR
jgi:hypothetical protein